MKFLKHKFTIAIISLVIGVTLFPITSLNPQVAHALPEPGYCPSPQDNMTMSFLRLKQNGSTIAEIGPIIARPPLMDISIGSAENPIRFDVPAGSQITVEADNTGAVDSAWFSSGNPPEAVELWNTNGNSPAAHGAVTPPINGRSYLLILAEYNFPGCPGYPSSPVTCVNPAPGTSGGFPASSCYNENPPTPTPGTSSTYYRIAIIIELVPPGSPPDPPVRKEAKTSLAIGSEPSGSFTFTCTPASHPDVTVGSNASFNLKTNPEGNFTAPVTVSLTKVDYDPQAGMPPGDYDEPVVTLDPTDPQTSPYQTPTVALVSTSPSNGLGTYTFTFTATGGGFSRACNVEMDLVTVNVTPPGRPIVQADSTRECEKVFITFEPNGLPTPTSYRLYRGTPFRGQLLKEFTAGERREYTDTYPGAQTSNNYYYVIAYSGNIASAPGVAGPANVRLCAPNLGDSDKDLIKVEGKITKPFDPTNPCNGSAIPNTVDLPPGAIFAVGDLLTFQINVCNNRGEREATNVQVTDRLYNINNPDTQGNLQNPQFLSSSGTNGAACATESGRTNDTISFNVGTLAAGSTCTIKFTARLVKPRNPTGPVYRFQNTGVITAGNHGPVEYYTPPYLFSLTGVPEREEIPPQQ